MASIPTKSEFDEIAITLLRAIEYGWIKVYLDGPRWDEVWCGNVKFSTDVGWKFVVFNDCGEWDYLDSITSPDGTTVDYDNLKDYPLIYEYQAQRTENYEHAEKK